MCMCLTHFVNDVYVVTHILNDVYVVTHFVNGVYVLASSSSARPLWCERDSAGQRSSSDRPLRRRHCPLRAHHH